MRKNIKEGERIIVFYSSVDIKRAIAYDGPLGTVYHLDSADWIYFSSDEKEASDHRYGSIRLSHVQPYSDALWAACEALDRDYMALSKRYDGLRRGRLRPGARTNLIRPPSGKATPMNEEMVHKPAKGTSIPQYYKLLAAMHQMSTALVREKNKVVRAGVTKNKSQGTSKARRRMAKQSRKQNRKK